MSLSYSGSSALSWFPTTFCAIVVTVRIYVRVQLHNLWIDDILMVLAWICQLLTSALGQTTLSADIYAVNYNLGRFLAERCTDSVFFSLALVAAKSSVALLLLRLVTNRLRRWIIYVSLGVLLIATVLEIVVIIVPPCTQAPSTWPVGACVPNTPLTTGFLELWNFYSAFFDILYSILPAVFLYRVRISWKKKAAIIVSLSMGWLASIFAILRAISFYTWGETDKAELIIHLSSVMEGALVIICGCLPILCILGDHVHDGKPLRPIQQSSAGRNLMRIWSGPKSNAGSNFEMPQISDSHSSVPLRVERRIDIDMISDHAV